MRRRGWLFWLALTLSALVGFSGLTFYLLWRGLRTPVPAVATGATLTVEISGDLPEIDLFDLAGNLFGVERVTLQDVLASIRKAREDRRVSGLLLRMRGAGFGWARAEELRSAVEEFRRSGKKVVSYLEYGGNLDYLIATASERIYLHPQAILDVRGLAAEVTFMKGALDKLGIEAELEQVGRYKNAPDAYTRPSMTDAHRQALQAIVDDLYDHLVAAIAASRRLDPTRTRELLDRGPFGAGEAKELGLVDELLYLDEAERRLGGEQKFQGVAVAGYRHAASGSRFDFGSRPRIALIFGEGAIVGGDDDDDPFFGRIMGSNTMAEAFRAAREDDSVKAVVFRINSPGGSDVAADVIWREAALTMEKKPLVVSMSDVAASGGYWIATASDHIVAEPTTLTGSIGIYGGKFNLAGLYGKIGFRVERVRRGASADFWSSSRRFTEEERRRFRRHLRAGYDRFLERVARARNKSHQEVDEIAQGRVWTGNQALARGLVDELGGLDRALERAKERAKLPPEDEVEIEVYPRRLGFFDLVLRRLGDGAPELLGLASVSPERLLERSPFLRLLATQPTLAMMPYQVRVR